MASSKFQWHHQISKPDHPLRPIPTNSGVIEQVVTGVEIVEKPKGDSLPKGKLHDFFTYYDQTSECHGEAINNLEAALALKAKGFLGFGADWVLKFRGQQPHEAAEGFIRCGKLRDFFKYYNADLPNHVAAVRMLENKLRKDAPELLKEDSSWVTRYRKPKPATNVGDLEGLGEYAFSFLEFFEGCHKKVGPDQYASYPDVAWGWEVGTIGIGSTKHRDGTKVRKGELISRKEAIDLVNYEVESIILPALKRIPNWARMNSMQKQALIIFSFNLGAHWYHASNFQSITRLANSPDQWGDKAFVKACFAPYCKANGSTLTGLVKRRKHEAIYFSGDEVVLS